MTEFRKCEGGDFGTAVVVTLPHRIMFTSQTNTREEKEREGNRISVGFFC